MYGDCIQEFNRFLASANEEYEQAKQTDPNFPKAI